MLTYEFNWLSFPIDLDKLTAYMIANCTNYNSMTCNDSGCTINFNTDYSTSDITILTNYLNGLTSANEATSIALNNITNEINNYRDGVLYNGFTYTDGLVYDSDSVSMTNVTATLTIINSGITLPSTFTWRTANNSNQPYSNSTFIAFAGAIFMWAEEVYAASWTHKANIAGLSTADAINSYNYKANWPANNYNL